MFLVEKCVHDRLSENCFLLSITIVMMWVGTKLKVSKTTTFDLLQQI